jgi:hypothetical protein
VAIYRLLQGEGFEPEAVKAMTDAYEETLRKLRLADRNDPVTEIIAGKIVEHARGGERDPYRLCEAVLREIAK